MSGYKLQIETREEWKTCPYCGGQQLAEVLNKHVLSAHISRYHLCLKCRHVVYNRLSVIEEVLKQEKLK